MPLDEQSTKAAARCQRHPNAHTVDACDRCERPLCIQCAVPVRGRIVGPECLAEVLGPDLSPAVPASPPRLPLRWTGAMLVVALLATILPWKRFGLGAGPFGAWGLTPRWSFLAGGAAVAGSILWAAVAYGRFRPSRRWVLWLRVCAAAVIAGAVLHLMRPPGFGPASFGPWVALAAGILAFASSFQPVGAAGQPSTPRTPEPEHPDTVEPTPPT